MGQGRREGHAERDAALDLLPQGAVVRHQRLPVRLGRADLRRHVHAAEPDPHQGRGRGRHVQPGHYSNKELDAIIDSIKTQTDAAKRDADIIKVLEGHAKDFGHIPCTTRSFPGPCARTSPSSIAPTTVWSPIGSRSTDPGQPAGGALRRVACSAYVCFHTPPPAAGCGGDAHRRAAGIRAISIRRRPRHHHAGPGRHRCRTHRAA